MTTGSTVGDVLAGFGSLLVGAAVYAGLAYMGGYWASRGARAARGHDGREKR